MFHGSMVADRYGIDAVLGVGGMGVVYAATDLALGRPVALKQIFPQMAEAPSVWRRFQAEAEILAELRTPHVPGLLAAHLSEPRQASIVTERLYGESLDERLSDCGPMPVGEAACYVSQACLALSDVHERGIVHRDVKPGNLFLARGADGRPAVKLIDFGIAHRGSEKPVVGDGVASSGSRPVAGPRLGPRITGTHESIGSPCYQSPEQMTDPGSVDGRADVWSLGVVLFELVTGVCPFDSPSIEETCRKVLDEPPPRLSDHRPGLPAAFERVVASCLQTDRDRRCASPRALMRQLAPFAWRRGDASRPGT